MTKTVYTLAQALDRIYSVDYMGLADSLSFITPAKDHRIAIVVQIPTFEDGTFDYLVASEAQVLKHELLDHSTECVAEDFDTEAYLRTNYRFTLADGAVFFKIKIRK